MSIIFFSNDTAPTEIYTLSLHDALPIFRLSGKLDIAALEFSLLTVVLRHETLRTTFDVIEGRPVQIVRQEPPDRKSTRLNSSHSQISYAVFCLKKKKKNIHN